MLKNNNHSIITYMAKRSFNTNKRRNSIIIFAIALSSFMLFTILTVGITWVQMQKRQNIRQAGGEWNAYIYGGFTPEQKKICQDNPNIEAVGTTGFCAWAISTKYDSTLHSIFVWADDTMWNTINRPAINRINGHYPKNENEIMTTREALEDCGLKNLTVGDSFTITYEDNHGQHTKQFTISGIWNGYGDKKIFYVSKSFFDQTGFTLEDYGRGFLYIKLKSPIITQKLLNEMEQSLNLGKKQHFLVNSDTKTSVQILSGLLGLVFITCLSAYLLIYNIMYLSVSGNVRYYGLLQTIGMTGKQVYRFIQKQMLFVGSIGIAAGILAGVAASFGLIPTIIRTLGIHGDDISVAFHPVIFLLTLLISVVTIYIGSKKPAKMAMQITPIEALGYRPQTSGSRTHKAKNGKLLWRMAWEQLCRDKKKSIMVIAALGICLSFFLCMTTLIKSQGPRTIVSSIMNEDISINNDTMQMTTKEKWKPLLDDNFFTELKQIPNISEIHPIVNAQIIVPWESGFPDYWMQEFYDLWMNEEYADMIDDYKAHPEKYPSYLVGIDQEEFQSLNKTLESPVDETDFLSGRSCILFQNGLKLDKKRTLGKSIIFYPYEPNAQTYQLTIQGMTDDSYYANLLGTAPTCIVSDAFVRQISSEPHISRILVNYQEEFDEVTENKIIELMKKSPYSKDFSHNSKIENTKELEQSQGNMLNIGIGITFVLALIGMMNYLNTSLGNIQNRQIELAIMESIGMTGKQVKSLLIRESLLYAAASLLVTLTFGLGITYLLYQSMNYRNVPFAVPILPIAAATLVIIALCIVIPLSAYRTIEHGESIVGRIRKFE